MRTFASRLKHSLFRFFYPSHCLHCGESIPEPADVLFCSGCSSLLDMLHPDERCPTCFCSHYDKRDRKCRDCTHGGLPYQRAAAVFDYRGPAATVIKKMKYGNQPHLAKGAAAFMVAQFIQLNWPMPDALVPVPMSAIHWIDRGYNQSALLAEEMGRLMEVPVWDVLKRRSGDYSQAGLSLSQRKGLEGKRFQLKPKVVIADKSLLMIDDVMTSGSTLRRCAEALAEGHPARLYALTFCRAD